MCQPNTYTISYPLFAVNAYLYKKLMFYHLHKFYSLVLHNFPYCKIPFFVITYSQKG